jgi:hypothetical protein
MSDIPAAWHPDPMGRHEYRYWDGERWTDHVADAGQASTDPLDAQGDASAGTGAAGTGAGDAGADHGTAGDAGAASQQGWSSPESGAYATDQGSAPGGPGQTQAGGDPNAGWSAGPGGGEAGSAPGPQAGWGGAQQQPGGNLSSGLAITALVLGILSLLFSWVPILGAIGGIIAAILGFIGWRKAKRGEAAGAGMAMGGLVTGVIAAIISIGITIALFAFSADLMQMFEEPFDNYEQCIEETGDEDFCQQQLEEDLMEQT